MRSASPGRRRGGPRSSRRWPARSSRRPRRARGSRRAAAGRRAGPRPTGTGRCRDRAVPGRTPGTVDRQQLSSAAAFSCSNCCSTRSRGPPAGLARPAGDISRQRASSRSWAAPVSGTSEDGEQIVGGNRAQPVLPPVFVPGRPGRPGTGLPRPRSTRPTGTANSNCAPHVGQMPNTLSNGPKVSSCRRSSSRLRSAMGRAPSCAAVAVGQGGREQRQRAGAGRARARLPPRPPAAAPRPAGASSCRPIASR